MIQFVQCPSQNGLYATPDVPPLKFYCSGRASIVVELQSAGVFSGSYTPDTSGLVEVDFGDIMSEFPSSAFMPDAEYHVQGDFVKRFSLRISDDDGSKLLNFSVANVRRKVAGQLSQLLAERFLTMQPAVKYTTKKSVEYLTFSSQGNDAKLFVKFYKDSGSENISLSGEVQDTVTFDVSPGKLLQKSLTPQASKKTYYDVYMAVPVNGIYKSVFSQRYVLQEETESEKYYVFENDLGGFDTIICRGLLITTPSITYNTARLSSGIVQLDDTDDHFVCEQKSGYFPAACSEWIKSFIKSKRQKYIYDSDNHTFRRIIMTSSGYEVNDRDGIICFSFTFIYDDDSPIEVGKPRQQTEQVVTQRIDHAMTKGQSAKGIRMENRRGINVSEKIECTSEKIIMQIVTEGEVNVFTSIDGETWSVLETVMVTGSTVRPYEMLCVGSYLKVESANPITLLNIIAV